MDYQARDRYRDPKVASEYDDARFRSWHGRLVHKNEVSALQKAVSTYCPDKGTFLDLPTGTGRMIPTLRAAGHNVVAADISNEMLAQAAARDDVEGVRFQQLDAEHMDVEDNTFDYALSHRFLTHVPNQVKAKVVEEFARVTKSTIILNMHFASNDPLSLLNRRFRPNNYSTYPIDRPTFERIVRDADLRVSAEIGTGWYEASSKIMVLTHDT